MWRIRLTALLLLAACASPTTTPVPTSISISPTTLSFTAIGQTATVVATVKDQNGAMMGARVEWMTTDETVASISSEGPISSITVTAVGAGTATIVASSNPVAVSAGVTVVQEAASLELSKDSLTFLTLGDTSRLTATVRDENGNLVDDAPVTWSSSDDNTATVSSTGLVTSVQGGVVTITATVGSVSATTSVRITVWSSVTAGLLHTCGMTTAGDAYCWGYNPTGQLGDGTTSDRAIPGLVTGGLTWQSLWASRSHHTCGVTTAGEAHCWGRNDYGQVGDNTTEHRRVPTLVYGGYTWQSIFGAIYFTCGVTTSSEGYCWGRNNYGQLGDDHGGDIGRPQHSVSGGYSWKSISAGEAFSCGVTTSVAILYEGYCWGYNFGGQLGIGFRSNGSVLTPTLVVGSHSWEVITAGQSHACGVTITGEAYCWGSNGFGQVGDGTTEIRPSPTLVSGGHTWQSLSAGREHTCGVTNSGDAYCWGHGGNSRLGTGSPNVFTDHPTPNLVSGGHSWSMISAGWPYTCGLTTSAEAYCWGDNTEGQIGNGTIILIHETPLATPTKVTRPWS